ncbi:MAG: septal ring lytic transglycosylase RlpA family protein [Cyanobacteria bacterium CRU_2_1]|nr:septal ring lytic transglycosylase RlpA family protein [Cyanobacteria bacterium CRU_2_1]
MGDQVIFWIDSDLAEHLDRSPELAAIAWINSLRSVFEIPPFTLVEAQSQMYGLVATDRRLSGIASWYGPYFHGRQTAMGEIFDQNELTAAHPSLPFGTYLRVTNLRTGKMVIVRINDRGPYFENRSLDLSREAARCLDSEIAGVVPYEAVIMESVELTQFRAAIRLEDAVDEPMQPSIARNPSKQ